MSGRPTMREVRLPGCKSLSARLLLLAACARGRSRLRGLSGCDDTRSLLAALRVLGARATLVGDRLEVAGWGGPPVVRNRAVDVGAAGASLRFLLPLLAAGDTEVAVTGTPGLWARPHEALLHLLRRLGTGVEVAGSQARPGVRIRGTGLPGGRWPVPVGPSSQFLSGLLLAAGFAASEVLLEVAGPIPSAGYVDLTLEALRCFRGPAAVRAVPEGFRVLPGVPEPQRLRVPGDPSAATFFLVALVLLGGRLRLRPSWSPVHPEARLQAFFFDQGLLAASGDALEATGAWPAAPLELDLDPAPDAGPALAVLAAFLPQGARLRGVGRLRWKESDRVAGCLRLLDSLGCAGRVEDGVLEVPGGGFRERPAHRFDPAGDHRLAMAAGIASLRAPWIEVGDPGCVAKSFPGFWAQLRPWREVAA